MSETITQTQAEDVIARANSFLGAERGATLDGDFAADTVAQRVQSVAERVEALLQAVLHPKFEGLYVPLSKHNANQFDEAAVVLPGHLVLVPSSLVEAGPSVFYPAVVSEDGVGTGVIRLHVLKRPYHRQIDYGASVILSAAGQSETQGIGDHGRLQNDGVEAEHFATLLAAAGDQALQSAWREGSHINHQWRASPSNSVVDEVSKRLFGQDIPQQTVSISREQVASGRATLLWHVGMREASNGTPETAATRNALLVVQGLGYQALALRPGAEDNVKQMLAA